MCLLSTECWELFHEMLVIVVVTDLHFCFFSPTSSKQTPTTALNARTRFIQSVVRCSTFHFLNYKGRIEACKDFEKQSCLNEKGNTYADAGYSVPPEKFCLEQRCWHILSTRMFLPVTYSGSFRLCKYAKSFFNRRLNDLQTRLLRRGRYK